MRPLRHGLWSGAPGLHRQKGWKKSYQLISTAAKEDNYTLVVTCEPLARVLFMHSGEDWFEDSLEGMYSQDKNAYAFLLGRTHSPKAARFLVEQLKDKRLDAAPHSAQSGMGGTEEGGIAYRYTFLFDTQEDPQELWLCPLGREDDTAWHYQLSTQDYSVIRQAEISE